MTSKKNISVLILALFCILLAGCVSVPVEKGELSRKIMGTGCMSEKGLVSYFLSQRPSADKKQVKRMAKYYIEEAGAEGINSDVAFAQMCLETGYLGFGNLVQPEQHNYCGLGATGPGNPGCVFENERLGVRAHIQHLHAYGTTEEVQLKKELIDPRYGWVHKTKFAETVFELAGVWAADKLYGEKIDDILSKMKNYR